MHISPAEHDALTKAVSAATREASKILAGRIQLQLARHGMDKFKNVVAGLDEISGPHRGELSTIALLDQLPPGVSNADIQKIINSQLFRGASYQLIAFYYIEAEEQQVDRQALKLSRYLARQLQMILEMSSRPQRSNQWDLIAYFGALITQVKRNCEAIAASLRWRVPRSVETMQWALEVVSAAHLQSIDTHLDKLLEIADFSQDDLSAIEATYRHQFISRHSSIELPDSSERIVVGYEDIFVPPNFTWPKDNISNNLNTFVDNEPYRSLPVPGSLVRASGQASTITTRLSPAGSSATIARPKLSVPVDEDLASGTWDTDFDGLLNDFSKVVVLGDPGAGKSTTSCVTTLNWIKSNSGNAFYIKLREAVKEEDGFDLVAHIRSIMATRYQMSEVTNEAVRAMLVSPNTLLVFDGLDEVVPPRMRRTASRTIESIAEKYPFAKLLVTSRKLGYESVRLDRNEFSVFALAPFTQDQSAQYATKWFMGVKRLKPTAADSMTRNLMRRSNGILELRSNPLMLALICLIYDKSRAIPKSRIEIYKRCLSLLLVEREKEKGLSDYTEILDEFIVALEAIAFDTFTSRELRADLTETRVREIAAGALQHVVPSQRKADALAKSLISHCRGRAWIFTDSGYNEHAEDIFGFTHECFREYLAASYIVHNSSSAEHVAESIIDIIRREQAEVLGQVAVAHSGHKFPQGSSEVIRCLLAANVGSRRSLIDFVARATDASMLNGDALGQVVSNMLQHSLRSLAWQIVLNHDYRHAEDITSIVYVEWAKIRDEDPGKAQDLAIETSWLWEILVSSGEASSADLALLFARDPRTLLARFFEGSLSTMRRQPTKTTLLTWTISTLRSSVTSASGIEVLRALCNLLEKEGPDSFCGIARPVLSTELSRGLDEVGPKLARALAKCARAGREPLSGMLYLTMAAIEICEQLSVATAVPAVPGVDIVSARRERRSLPGTEVLTPACESFFQKWLTVWPETDAYSIFHFPDDQVVS